MKIFSTIACGLIAATIAVAPAMAATIVFTGGNSSQDGTDGNVRSFTSDDGTIKVQATAYSVNPSNAAITNAYLGWYDKGLGVTNQTEGDGTSDSSHVIDNSLKQDFVVLVFNKTVNLSGGVLTPFKTGGSTDNDAWVGWASQSDAFDTTSPITSQVTGTTLNTLLSSNNGKNVEGGLSTATPAYFTNFATGSKTGNVWIVGAARDGSIDGFKLGSITVTVPPAVPEPATWAMMIAGFGTVGMAMRRRRRVEAMLSTAA